MADSLRRPDGALRAGDLLDPKVLAHKLNRTRNEMVAQSKQLPLDRLDYENALVERELSTFDVPLEELVAKYNRFSENVYILDRTQVFDLLDETAWAIFEGAQGVLLDENHGFHPYTTWSTTTSTNAHAFLQEFGQADDLTELGIVRTYSTRHGPGPFPTYNLDLTAKVTTSGEHNGTSAWQKDFRCGWLDLALMDYALRLNGTVDGLVVTHVDHLQMYRDWPVTVEYPDVDLSAHNDLMEQERHLTEPLTGNVKQDRVTVPAEEVLDLIEATMHATILMTSEGATPSHKKFNEKPNILPQPHSHSRRDDHARTKA
jgi:adenylosuccinate synthase